MVLENCLHLHKSSLASSPWHSAKSVRLSMGYRIFCLRTFFPSLRPNCFSQFAECSTLQTFTSPSITPNRLSWLRGTVNARRDATLSCGWPAQRGGWFRDVDNVCLQSLYAPKHYYQITAIDSQQTTPWFYYTSQDGIWKILESAIASFHSENDWMLYLEAIRSSIAHKGATQKWIWSMGQKRNNERLRTSD